ncbi:MAG TPA: Gfo/Idh/MocA family oxidoreductase [Rectinemataceae bacterium]|nr:Gfo/Idh/MocA family oxidoreductase [Rectinemataceae bacterium]
MKAALRLGIVGSGAMAEYHAKRFAGIEGVVVAAVADRDRARALAFGERMGIAKVFGGVEELLASGALDAVAVSNRDAGHPEACIEALSRGLPVFCEKPLARRESEAAAMVHAAGRAGLPTLVNFSKRNGGLLSLARDLVADGAVGEIEEADFSYLQDWLHHRCWGDWRTNPRWQWRLDEEESSHGVLGDLGSHCVDAMLFVIGDVEVRAATARRFVASENEAWRPGLPAFVAARGLLASAGLPIHLDLSYGARTAKDSFRLTIRGSKADLVLDLEKSRDELTIVEGDGAEQRSRKAPSRPSTYERFVLLARGETDPSPEVLPDFAHGQRVAAIIDGLAALATRAEHPGRDDDAPEPDGDGPGKRGEDPGKGAGAP